MRVNQSKCDVPVDMARGKLSIFRHFSWPSMSKRTVITAPLKLLSSLTAQITKLRSLLRRPDEIPLRISLLVTAWASEEPFGGIVGKSS